MTPQDALAMALDETVGKLGWLRATPPDPVQEWLMNADAILAALPPGWRLTAEPPLTAERLARLQ